MANKKNLLIVPSFEQLLSLIMLQRFCLNCGAAHAVNNKTHRVENIGPVIQVGQFPRLYSQLNAEKQSSTLHQ